METKEHWDKVYATKAENEVSWFQERARLSVQLIKQTNVTKDASIIDIGGGASILVDDLLSEGFHNLSVLDISGEALKVAQKRLGASAAFISWIEADITSAELPERKYDVWHDRAVFHFLTRPAYRSAYVRAVEHSVVPGGHIIIGTFSMDGPNRCSGLDVMRYNPESMHAEFGEHFHLVNSVNETHRTPFGTDQGFVYCYCRKE